MTQTKDVSQNAFIPFSRLIMTDCWWWKMQISWGSGGRVKIIAGQKEWLENILHPPHPGRFLAVLGTNAVGEEERERGSSNRRRFATSAENTDEKRRTRSWGWCSFLVNMSALLHDPLCSSEVWELSSQWCIYLMIVSFEKPLFDK